MDARRSLKNSRTAARRQTSDLVPQEHPNPSQAGLNMLLCWQLIPPADVLRLQRIIGNRATAALLSAARTKTSPTPRSAPPVQRLVADGHTKLYAPKAWFDETLETRKPDDTAKTLRAVALTAHHAGLKLELGTNMEKMAGITVTEFEEVNPPSKTLETLVGDGKITTTGHKRRQLKSPLAQELVKMNSVTVLPAGGAATIHNLDKKLIVNPKEVIEDTNDLANAFDILKACVLIAIVKGEGANRARLNQKMALAANLANDRAYYERLHQYYYVGKHYQYDEAVNQPAIYAEWGYKFIFSGNSTFANLHTVIDRPLKVGKKYIVVLTDHAVFVDMRKDLQPGVAMGAREVTTDYFNFHSDPQNYNLNEQNSNVEYIYEYG